MSTAGKVLVVLVTIALVVWSVLLASVAHINDVGGEQYAKQASEISKLEEDLAKTKEDVTRLKSEITRDQVARENEAIVFRSEVADREKTLSETKESLERAKNQVTGQEQALASSKIALQRRTDEKAQTLKDIAEFEAEVERRKGETDVLLAQLTKLQNDYIATRTENERLVRRVSSR